MRRGSHLTRALQSVACALALAIALYAAWPFATALKLHHSIKSGDTAWMNALIDWDATRTSLRLSIEMRLQEKAAQRPDNPTFLQKVKFAVADAVSPYVVDHMIAQRLSPEGLTAYARKPAPGAVAAADGEPPPDTTLQRLRRFGFLDLTHVQFEVVDKIDPGKAYRAVLELKDFVWRLTRVEMLSLGSDA